MQGTAAFLRLALLLLAYCGGTAAQADDGLTRYLTGSLNDVDPPLSGPAHLFLGGGGDVDEAHQWLIDEVRGCTTCEATLDVVILRASGSDGYNDYLYAMNGVDSVDTYVITSVEAAKRPEVAEAGLNAEVVFFAGGHQCNYVKYIKDTPLEGAVEDVYARGGGVGGNSAGLAIQGAYVYDACTGSETSERALADPYDGEISFTYDFFNWRHLEQVITDTHVDGRERLGRTMTFLARQICDGVTPSALAVAVSEATGVVVDAEGLATVMGEAATYFILADHAPEVCESGQPLTFSDLKIWKVESGGTFDLAHRPSSGYYSCSIDQGVLSMNPY
jgi:cyanophycinase-like exopeptidase